MADARSYYLIAGERSGDLHGGNLIRELKKREPDARFRAWGGEQMESAGADLVVHYKKLAFMGFWEVIMNLGTIRRFMKQCKKDIISQNPDVLILIDYPGFNLRMAKFAHNKGIKVLYYISPKIWAWNQKRAYKIRKYVNRMFVILPFEKKFYQSFDYEVDYVGNPLMDAVSDFEPNPDFRNKNNLDNRPVIAILPGSRKQEIHNMLETMIALGKKYKEYQLVVAGVSNLDPSFYELLNDHEDIKLVMDETYDLLHIAEAALVTSGTAALETAIFNVPQVVCYKTSFLTYLIGKQLIRVDFISLVNLIAGKEVVRELIQNDFNINRLEKELNKILKEGEGRSDQLADYEQLRAQLSTDSPSAKTALLIKKYLENS